jgi:hypothetical protein
MARIAAPKDSGAARRRDRMSVGMCFALSEFHDRSIACPCRRAVA